MHSGKHSVILKELGREIRESNGKSDGAANSNAPRAADYAVSRGHNGKNEVGKMVWMGIAKRRKAMSGEGNHWSYDVCDPHDDPWNPLSPFTHTTDDSWLD